MAHRELLAEAEFYQLAGLCELLRGRLLELEDKGERLRRLSIDTAIADTRGGFDSLLSQIYAEMEGKAAQVRAALQMGEMVGRWWGRSAWAATPGCTVVAPLRAANGAHERACRVPWQGKRVVTIAYTQEKRVAGALFRSPQDGFWDQKVRSNLAAASPPHAQSARQRDGTTHDALPS